MKQTYFLIFLLFMNCNSKPETDAFVSNFGYSILLPENWPEYEDEDNTNAFFDTKEWTGNLRITPVKIDPNKNSELLKSEMESFNGKAEPFKTKEGFKGLKYSEKNGQDFMYYWYIIAKNKMFICSFTIDLDKKDTPKNLKELEKVAETLNSIELKNTSP
ncbi:DUF3805 domain-containing protein [Flavobacterium daemonense]|uniref:DUF3805 domain-containing protein n=1 Tax=Flavobacterium daemonense TaxID=1393049 RepID=UPI001184B80B|nr:DUF3805 domain-containing protein [Flavobacterium daemonense]KAF2328194.1 DUF3805 domain-containing protein [Flavobacterium daemonense]